jgi:hypothetical protein
MPSASWLCNHLAHTNPFLIEKQEIRTSVGLSANVDCDLVPLLSVVRYRVVLALSPLGTGSSSIHLAFALA